MHAAGVKGLTPPLPKSPPQSHKHTHAPTHTHLNVRDNQNEDSSLTRGQPETVMNTSGPVRSAAADRTIPQSRRVQLNRGPERGRARHPAVM